jgi:hypothetical protein
MLLLKKCNCLCRYAEEREAAAGAVESRLAQLEVGEYFQTVLPIDCNRSTYRLKPFYLSSATVLPID